MSDRYKVVTGSNVLKRNYWTAKNENDQKKLDQLVELALRANVKPAEAIEPLANYIVEQCKSVDIDVTEAYFIRHDIDSIGVNDDINPLTGKKYPHIHWVLTAKSKHSLEKWSKGLGVAQNCIEKLNRGCHAKLNALAYLIHIKYPDKAQYYPTDVYTAAGQDYQRIYDLNNHQWKKATFLVEKKRTVTDESKAELISRCLRGELVRDNIMNSEELKMIYTYDKTRIDTALALQRETRAMEAAVKLEEGQLKKTGIFITGKAGAGKSYFAKTLCSALKDKTKDQFGTGWQAFLAGTKNPIDGYDGEEILLFDDIRPSKLDVDDWKALFDPHKIPSIGTRYRNTTVSSSVLMVTTTLSIHQYYYPIFREAAETMDQILRRIEVVVEVVSLIDNAKNDVKPNDDNTLIYIKTLMTLPDGQEKVLKVSGHKILTTFTHETLAEMSHGLTISEAIEYLVNLITESFTEGNQPPAE